MKASFHHREAGRLDCAEAELVSTRCGTKCSAGYTGRSFGGSISETGHKQHIHEHVHSHVPLQLAIVSVCNRIHCYRWAQLRDNDVISPAPLAAQPPTTTFPPFSLLPIEAPLFFSLLADTVIYCSHVQHAKTRSGVSHQSKCDNPSLTLIKWKDTAHKI